MPFPRILIHVKLLAGVNCLTEFEFPFPKKYSNSKELSVSISIYSGFNLQQYISQNYITFARKKKLYCFFLLFQVSQLDKGGHHGQRLHEELGIHPGNFLG
jgi:hypothetical protein